MTEKPSPFAALLADVPRITVFTNDGTILALPESEVLAAAAAVPADLAEAGKVLEGVTPGPWKAHHEDDYSMIVVHEPSFTQIGHLYEAVDAEFVAWTREGVPALLARIVAQEAQIKGLGAELRFHVDDAVKAWNAAEVAETALAAERAKVAKLVEAVERWADHDGESGYKTVVRDVLRAIAAITEAGHE